mmetsp:Transcript_33969/g.83099  ORF Transcript_33969/g.83099 Transcript_33969/m.83099 type:complete len:298 (+) Transcript_33969:83-976(+)
MDVPAYSPQHQRPPTRGTARCPPAPSSPRRGGHRAVPHSTNQSGGTGRYPLSTRGGRPRVTKTRGAGAVCLHEDGVVGALGVLQIQGLHHKPSQLQRRAAGRKKLAQRHVPRPLQRHQRARYPRLPRRLVHRHPVYIRHRQVLRAVDHSQRGGLVHGGHVLGVVEVPFEGAVRRLGVDAGAEGLVLEGPGDGEGEADLGGEAGVPALALVLGDLRKPKEQGRKSPRAVPADGQPVRVNAPVLRHLPHETHRGAGVLRGLLRWLVGLQAVVLAHEAVVDGYGYVSPRHQEPGQVRLPI